MAALPDRYTESLIDLRDLNPDHLAKLLEEETAAWRSELDWDFRASADLVRRFLQLRSLNGFALAIGGQIAGYSYYVAEDSKGLIGDFFLRPAFHSLERQLRLLQASLDAIWRTPGTCRVEAQLMMLSAYQPRWSAAGTSDETLAARLPVELQRLLRAMPYGGWFHAFPRLFLEAPLAGVRSLLPRETGLAFGPWTESWQDEAASLIANAYRGHIDSQINDQYRSPAGARRFLVNIVQYPGCGVFFAPGSFVAWERSLRGGGSSMGMCGVSLASLVAPEVGHITQICVAREYQSRGLGYELLRRSLAALAAQGCRSVSLTVTTANQSALRLYQQMGFRTRREFSAYVWEMGGAAAG